MPFCCLFLSVGMLSLRSGFVTFGSSQKQEPTAAVSGRNKTLLKAAKALPFPSDSYLIKLGMTDRRRRRKSSPTPIPPKNYPTLYLFFHNRLN